MIAIQKTDDALLLRYFPPEHDITWLVEKLQKEWPFLLKRTFTFRAKDVTEWPAEPEPPEFDYQPSCQFLLGRAEGAYYKIVRGILLTDRDIYLDKTLEITKNSFYVEYNISIFELVVSVSGEDIYIGGPQPGAIPLPVFQDFLAKFPNSYERRRYAQARVAYLLKEHLASTVDAETDYHRYMNRKMGSHPSTTGKLFKQQEVEKYAHLLDKMKNMLAHEDVYSEKQWQRELLAILRLLYPKYIAVLPEASIPIDGGRRKRLDFVLVDANGHVDIVEIKRPFGNRILSDTLYRNNYVPFKDLSDVVMQVEKYLYHLDRHASVVEPQWEKKYRTQLPANFHLHVTNPSGIIVTGRSHTLNERQQHDFEVIRRHYKNVVDIITYDDLIRRLEIIIEQIQKL